MKIEKQRDRVFFAFLLGFSGGAFLSYTTGKSSITFPLQQMKKQSISWGMPNAF